VVALIVMRAWRHPNYALRTSVGSGRLSFRVMWTAKGRQVMIPTYSPWLNPAEILWRRLRREVTHCELFESIDALLDATRAFFDRLDQTSGRALSAIGAYPT
jgi:putative transposase